jgi:hypothetical protein
MLDLVARHEPARTRDDAPPREVCALPSQQSADRAGGSHETGLSRHLSIGHYLASAHAPDDSADAAGELRGRRGTCPGIGGAASRSLSAVGGVSCGSGDHLNGSRA